MASRLPFEALRAFVHAARAASFRRAAEQLNLTPGALSQRIAALEAHLGMPLFRRTAQGVELLPAGQRLVAEVGESLETIETALDASRPSERLRLHTVGSFANLWLIPRLGSFRQRNPDIEVAIETSSRLSDLSRGYIRSDLAIRYGRGAYPGLEAHEILRPGLALIVATPLLARCGDAALAEVLRSLPLLHDRNRQDWEFWLDRLAIPDDAVTWGPALDDDAGMIQAALAGQGVASVRDLYLDRRLTKAGLTRLASCARAPEAFYLVGRRERLERRDARAFLRWLREEAARFSEWADEAGFRSGKSAHSFRRSARKSP